MKTGDPTVGNFGSYDMSRQSIKTEHVFIIRLVETIIIQSALSRKRNFRRIRKEAKLIGKFKFCLKLFEFFAKCVLKTIFKLATNID